MNILEISHYGLYENFTSSFVHNQIKEFVKLGHRVRIIVPIPIAKKDCDNKRFGKVLTRKIIDGVEIFYLRFLSLSNFGKKCFNTQSAKHMLKASFGNIFENFTPDIIHSHTFGLDSELGSYIKGKFDVPLVVTTHGSDTSIPFENREYTQIKKYCENVDYIVAVSYALEDKLKKSGVINKTKYILNGFNSHSLRLNKKTQHSFIQVSNLIKQKKVDVTIKAFSEIYKQYPLATLKIIGAGPEEDRLKSLCQELGIKDNVLFLGQVSNDKVLEEMSKSEFFIMPSVREGFGIVYLEAMASGCVTIGTKGEGIADLIVDGKNGILVEPNNSQDIVNRVFDIIDDNEQKSKISKNGIESAKGLTWECNANKYIELFEELINNR